MRDNELIIGEHFYSVQGEGVSVGCPSYFIRFSGCNLNCGGPNGSLLESGQATWHCDSELIWRKPQRVNFQEIIEIWKHLDILKSILTGHVHLIFTGGEPLLYANLKQINGFLNFLKEDSQFAHYNDEIGDIFETMFIEIETNGTQRIPDEYESLFYNVFKQINCSPKLANSGNSKNARIIPDALKTINEHSNSYFKLVISEEKDLLEYYDEIAFPEALDLRKIIIMPAMTSQSEFFEKTKMIFELSKKYKVRGVPRTHIAAWDKVTGV